MKGIWHRLPCVLVAMTLHDVFLGGSSSGEDVESGKVVSVSRGNDDVGEVFKISFSEEDVVGVGVRARGGVCGDVAGGDVVGGVVSRRVLAGKVAVNGTF